jgi:tripartite-type tricarboxylate transporter receptor subunit TctC
MNTRSRTISILVALTLLVTVGGIAAEAADNFPTRPMRWIVGREAGGSMERTVRLYEKGLEEILGVPQLVECRPGAAMQVGHTLIQTAAPDGYTWGILGMPHLALNHLTQDAPFTIDDFVVLAIVNSDPTLVNSQKEMGFKTMVDFIEYTQANPGKIRVGATSGVSEYAALWMIDQFDLDVAFVRYDGGPGRAAFLGKHIDVYFGAVVSNEELRDFSDAIGVMWPDRNIAWPDAPTFDEVLKPKYDVSAPYLSSMRSLGTTRKIMEANPERFKKVYDALYQVHHAEKFKAEAEKAGFTPVLTWVAGEEAMKTLKDYSEFIKTIIVK